MIDVISFSVGASLVNLIPFYRFVLLHACCMVLAFLRVYDEQCGGGPYPVLLSLSGEIPASSRCRLRTGHVRRLRKAHCD